VLLNLLIWLPLFIFSTGSLSNYDNFVRAGSLSVRINGFPTLYSASTAEYISPILPADSWTRMAQRTPSLAILPATSTNEYSRELQYVRMPAASAELWQISPPAQEELLSVLRLADDSRASGSAVSAAADSPADGAGITLQFSFTTEDGTVNDGQVGQWVTGGGPSECGRERLCRVSRNGAWGSSHHTFRTCDKLHVIFDRSSA
jgi:hypothetical protein